MADKNDPAEDTLYARAGDAFTPAQAGEPAVEAPVNLNSVGLSTPEQIDAMAAKKNAKAVATPESSYEKLANDQADQYLQMTSGMFPSTSSLAATDTAANQGAAALLGQSATSPMEQWLNQQSAASQAQYAPVAAAESSVEGAEQNATNLEAGAIRGFGTAETAAANAAPYTTLLSALANEVPYQLVKGYLPSWSSAPAWLKEAEAGAGVPTAGQGTSASSTAGATPILPPVAQAAEGASPSPAPTSGSPAIPK